MSNFNSLSIIIIYKFSFKKWKKKLKIRNYEINKKKDYKKELYNALIYHITYYFILLYIKKYKINKKIKIIIIELNCRIIIK